MRTRLMRLGAVIALAAAMSFSCVADSSAAINRNKQKYLKKNLPPLGWEYQAGYTLWRLERGLAATPQTWRRYVREKKWSQQRGKESAADKLILKSLDWTTEELAALLAELEETVSFQPAGTETVETEPAP
nr:hypothetical protein [uncultured Fretibacterium sp.]